ncbi:MAG: TlpA family protein disulfide reductase [Muribaculaceae bacterium]|nr:TlpA family protein disulfide reductase [Muribaculaceae bacterium]
MKRLFVGLFAGLLALSVIAQDDEFRVSVVVDGLGPTVMYYLTDAGGTVNDYGIKTVKDGRLDFSHSMNDVGYLVIMFNPSTSVFVPAVPGEYAVLGGNIDNCSIDGSPIYKAYGEAMAGLRPLIDASQHFDFKKDYKQEIEGKSSEEVYDLYQAKWRALSRAVSDAALAYIKQHHDQEVSMMLMNQLGDISDLEQVEDAEVLDGRMYPYFVERNVQVDETGFSNPLINKLAPDFTLYDVNGTPLSLSSLRGKWVLLNFWGATCGNAVSQFPDLKELYSKYKDQIEILGVGEDDEDVWKNAVISTYALPWKNVNGFYNEESDTPSSLYNVTGYPTYFLITPSGKVVMMSHSVQDAKYIFELLFD